MTSTHRVLEKLANLRSNLQDAETGQRGYLITGDGRYLEPYLASVGNIDGNLRQLKVLTTDNPDQQRRLERISPLVQTRLDALKEAMALPRHWGPPPAIGLAAQ